ncbi:glycosyltransferase [Rhodobacteraceae bacterium nBUS_24]
MKFEKLKIIYVVGFTLSGYSGRAQGSLAKFECFSASRQVSEFKSLSLKGNHGSKLIKIFKQIGLLFRLWFHILIRRPTVVIHRDVPFVMITRYLYPGVFLVSEVHAAPWEETESKGLFKKIFIFVYKYQYLSNINNSNLVIYNHPYLEKYYAEKCRVHVPSTSVYNGGFFPKTLNYEIKMNTSLRRPIIFSYCGNINFWHGVDQIIPILEELNRNEFLFKFYLVGGQNDQYTQSIREKFQNVRNAVVVKNNARSNLEEYISKSDYCFLPVANVRTSPGNPIKLFDYVRFGKRVITQEYLHGYADLLPTELGHLHIDFSNPIVAANNLLKSVSKTSLETEKRVFQFASVNQNWSTMVDQWIDKIELLRSKGNEHENHL